ncbi:Disease resistance protein RUN1 [Linum perenne]
MRNITIFFYASTDFPQSRNQSMAQQNQQFDVFLSFRGGDTRDGFTSHLYAALLRKNVAAYMDAVSLERGEQISPSLLGAIARSKVCVVVLSEDYAASAWCLDEVTEITAESGRERPGGRRMAVMPVFYRVEPEDVRDQLGSYAEAFGKHETVYEKEKVNRWRDALKEIGNLSGWDSFVTRPESKLVDEVVNDVLYKLHERCPPPTQDPGLVGMESRIQQVESLLHLELPNDDVLTIGIWGMGGIGKTTLAKAIFDQLSPQFEGSFFLENVQEQLRKSKTIFLLREELIRQILENRTLLATGNPNTRLEFVRDRLRCRKVLVVLDDVNDSIQLQEILGGYQFGPGSRIIVTGRDKHVLSIVAGQIYEVKSLNPREALQLFCLNAFRKGHSLKDGDIEFSKRFADYTSGNPLAIRVLGLSLLGKSREDWQSKMKRLGRISNPNIQSVLRVSYDSLDQEEQSVFLDIACFFRGEDRDHVIKVLDACHSSVRIIITTLVDKSLATVSSSNTLEMHDLVQELGWGIVHQQLEPGQRTRLWNPKDVFQVLTKKKASSSIEGLFLNLSKAENMHLEGDSFARMDRLRLLKFHCPDYRSDVCKVHLPRHGLQSMSDELTLLYWHGFPSKSLPSNFCAENLVELILPFSKVTHLWTGVQNLGNLRLIDLEGSENLKQIPDLSEAENLETVVLDGCERLVEIPCYFQYHMKLSGLHLKKCKNLRLVPTRLDSQQLKHLDMSSCEKVETCPEVSTRSLQELNLSRTAIREIPTSVCREGVPKVLNLEGCSNMTSIPEICGGVKKLFLSGTAIKEVVPTSIDHLLELEEFRMTDNKALTSFGGDIGKLRSLKLLDLSGCSNLEYFRDMSGSPLLCRVIRLHGCNKLSKKGTSYSKQFDSALNERNMERQWQKPVQFCMEGKTRRWRDQLWRILYYFKAG